MSIQSRDVKIDAALTNFAIGYRPTGLIADLIAPRVPVDKDSANYYIFGSENMKDFNTIRAPKSAPNIVEDTISTTTYQTKGHSLGSIIDDRDRERAPFQLDTNTVESLMDKMLTRLEIEIYNAAALTTNYASASFYTTLSGSDQFNSGGAGPDLEKLIDDAAAVVRTANGVAPNTLIIPYAVAMVMKRMSQIQEQRKNVTDLTQQSGLPPQLWGYRVLIAGGIKDSAKQGQTKSFANIWGDQMTLAYIDPQANWKAPAWMKDFTLGNRGFYVTREPLPSHVAPYNAELIEVFEEGRDIKVVGTSAAYTWFDCLA